MSASDLMPPVFDLVRVTIELRSPLTIGGGEQDDLRDHAAVVDANGLPTLPGTSIAGVLRHALAVGDPDTDEGIRAMFGYQDPQRGATAADGASSRIWTSWGQVHDKEDRPFPMLAVTPAQRRALTEDLVLKHLAEGTVRDHVSLNARGVPGDRKKFESLLVPRGARFTFEIGIAPAPDKRLRDRFSVKAILARLASPQVRLGGRTLRGFGSFDIKRILHRRFDLSNSADAGLWARLPRALEQAVPGGVLSAIKTDGLPRSDRGGWVTVERNYQPEDLFLPGGGEGEDWAPEIAARGEGPGEPRVPVTERFIHYDANNRGAVSARGEPYMPGTGIKGALRHRVAFHARALRGETLDPQNPELADALDLPDPPEVVELFGRARGDEGLPGRVIVEDMPIKLQGAQWLDHVSLDRYSGGPMDGLLFSELAHARTDQLFLGLRLHVRVEGLSEHAARALELAVEDLGRGRLAIGGGASRGHGYLEDIDPRPVVIARSQP